MDLQIRISPADTQTVHLNEEHKTIAELKEQIASQCSVPVDEQTLFFKTRKLEDEKTLQDYAFSAGDIVTLGTNFEAKVRLRVEYGEEQIQLEAKRNSSILEVKEEISKMKELSIAQQVLCLGNCILEDEYSVFDYQLGKHSDLVLSVETDIIQVNVVFFTGDVFRVSTKVFSTVEALKVMLAARKGVPYECMRLFYQDTQLDDKQTLDHYQIGNEASISLKMRSVSSITIHVKTPDTTLCIDILHDATIKQLKHIITSMIEVKESRQVLSFASQELEDKNTLFHYNIWKEATLQLTFKQYPQINLKLNLQNGKNLEIQAEKEEQVLELKEKLESITGIPLQWMRLVFEDKILMDSHTLSSYSIQEGSELTMKTMLSGMQIQVKKLNKNEYFVLSVLQSDTIWNVKNKIFAQEGIHPEIQHITFANYVLVDYKTLEECRVRDSAMIHLMELTKPKSYLFIRTWANKPIAVQYFPKNTIAKLKSKIYDKEGIPVSRQQLFYMGLKLKDEMSLEEYSIQEEDTLQLQIHISKGINVLIRYGFSTFMLTSYLKQSVIQLKQVICGRTQIPVKNQELLLDGRPIQDDSLMSQHQTMHKCILDLKYENTILVNQIDGNKFYTKIDPNSKISVLKQHIYDLSGVASELQNLYYSGRYLENDELASVIEDDDSIQLYPEKEYIVYVKQGDKSVEVTVQPMQTVYVLKQGIEHQLNVPASQQNLFLDEVLLKDTDTLTQSKVFQEALLSLA